MSEWKIGDECWPSLSASGDTCGRIVGISEPTMSALVDFGCGGMGWWSLKYLRRAPMVRSAPEVTPADPLAVLIDGVTLRALIAAADLIGREDVDPFKFDYARWSDFTPAQRTAISVHRSAELRARIAAGPSADAAKWRKEQQPSVWLDCAEEL